MLPKRIVVAFYALMLVLIFLLFTWLAQLSDKLGGAITGLGSLAFFFGLRHAVDADHLAAIDNSVRKLTQESRESLFAGTFFSLGHSTVVILLSTALIFASREVVRSVPQLQSLGALLGTLISGGVLYLLGALNLIVALEIYSVFRRVVKGEETDVDQVLLRRGLMGRFFRNLFKLVGNQYYLYPIGFLFGLGFDTATETALLTISASTASLYTAVPPYELLVLPLLFTVGMMVVDSSDGFFMNSAYRWAFSGDTVRKVWYNLSMTVISVIVAFLVGSLELLGLLQAQLRLSGWPWYLVGEINSESYWSLVGVTIVGVFAVSWIISYLVYVHKVDEWRS